MFVSEVPVQLRGAVARSVLGLNQLHEFADEVPAGGIAVSGVDRTEKPDDLPDTMGQARWQVRTFREDPAASSCDPPLHDVGSYGQFSGAAQPHDQ